MLVGDFNRLNYRHICNHFNLRQIVRNPTRGRAILDLVFTNLFHNYTSHEILPAIFYPREILNPPVRGSPKSKIRISIKKDCETEFES